MNKDCKLETKPRHPKNNSGFDEATALAEARRCLMENECDSCDLCQLICPDLCLTKNETTNQPEINYALCRGCGLCAVICPKNAIQMVPEIDG